MGDAFARVPGGLALRPAVRWPFFFRGPHFGALIAANGSFVAGVALFFVGMGINIHSDYTLLSLRKPGEKGYKIPRGGLFEYVSGANYFGECLEWAGFALASWSLVAAAFAVFTFSNIAPRGYKHHLCASPSLCTPLPGRWFNT